ncbi:hypothetical protein BGV40_16010 [Methanosarcina sp. Ant1]|nr:hypothetical protein BGV40_16005 [Methanosarcina sp. Ant1]OEU41244.1 hypothetical protein BGV40_16010 [Methanosarcina sp. Ant1]
MFIREFKTKKKDKIYYNHKLVESYRNIDNKPRQRTIMSLGTLSNLPKERWRELAFILEQKITGQETFTTHDKELECLADKLYASANFYKNKIESKKEAEEQREFVSIDINSVQSAQSRSIGAELVAKEMWDRLKISDTLKDCGFSTKKIAVAQALIMGRLIHPGSELATHRWFNEASALAEMLEEDIHGLGKDSYYSMGDLLFQNRKEIELALYNRETTLFSLDRKLFLFDLTNTYLEGSGKNNELAAYGVSKEKRKDCPLISLALMVDSKGFPVYSRILKGNQSEPETLKDVLEELSNLNKNTLITNKPTLIMDRGIATKDNLLMIKEYGYSYTLIERSPVEKKYEPEYAELKNILESLDHKETLKASGWETIREESGVYAKSVIIDGATRVLVLSTKRACKEISMNESKENRFLTDIEKLRHSVEAGNIKILGKVMERIGRLKEKYKGIAKIYDIQVILSEDEKMALSLTWTKLCTATEKMTLSGCYVIETDRQGLTAQSIWNDYMTITRVESAFRDLKSELGFRPIYHHTKERTEAHLFIGVLAYHLLVSIETILRSAGDTREWNTIRETLSTHHRSTIIMTGEDGTIYNIRVTGNPEKSHNEIYKIFEIVNFMKRKKSTVNERR